MALSEDRLKNKIIAIIDATKVEEENAETAKNKFAQDLAKAIVEEIKQGDVTGLCPENAGALQNGKIN